MSGTLRNRMINGTQSKKKIFMNDYGMLDKKCMMKKSRIIQLAGIKIV